MDKLGMVAHAFDPSAMGIEAEQFTSSNSAWAT